MGKIRTALLLILCVHCIATFGQVANARLSTSDNGLPLSTLVSRISDNYDGHIFSNPSETERHTVNGADDNELFSVWIKDFIRYWPLNYIQINRSTILLVNDDILNKFGNKAYNYKILDKEPDKPIRLTGKIIDSDTKEPIPGVQLAIPGTGTISDEKGRFSLNLTKGIFPFEVRFIGYETLEYVLCVNGSGELNLVMEESYRELEELVITAEAENAKVMSEIVGVERMDISTIEELPTFMGEVDPIKFISTLPGVNSGELSSGYNVRGGSAGQNLILIDGGIIFNPSHMFGLFSVFNPDLIKEIELYKGGGPANIGGRVSSTLDISMRNGRTDKFGLEAALGPVSSRICIDAPLIKNKSSLVVGVRSAYPDWIINQSDDLDVKNNQASFTDISTKYHHYINSKNVISFSTYYSYDDFLFSRDSVYNEWQTLNFSGSWIHNLNERSSFRLEASRSNYNSKVEDSNTTGKFTAESGHNILRLKSEIKSDWNQTTHGLFGLEVNKYTISPGRSDYGNGQLEAVEKHHGLEAATYAQLHHEWGQFSLGVGLRLSTFLRLGPGRIYDFDASRNVGIVDSADYQAGELIDQFFNLEPRFSARYSVSPTTSLKVGYYRTSQYLHLISNTISSVPQDYWIASGPQIEPIQANQFSVGLFQSSSDFNYEFSIEPFWKTNRNSLTYMDGLDITQNPYLEGGLLQGRERAYGIEVLIKKKQGETNGWISYTYSRSYQKFNISDDLGTIEPNSFFSAPSDIPHNLSMVINRQLSVRSNLTFNFNYKTGNPITIPVANHSSNGILSVLTYSGRNEYRAPDYHRLDVSLSVKERDIRNKRINGEWQFSIYNLYGRKNAFSVYFDEYGRAQKLYVLGSIFPSVSYNFKI